ncbi:MAG: hypothetical protein JFT10_07005 [Muribaculaceae bacterium]|nr:hypothetical protein [Duncaniella dubosii]MBJ2190583.1 hypothetical protein [Muribaculaceae bacterium]MCX4285332.1 hypothetical protein [Duncaniella dubosii]
MEMNTSLRITWAKAFGEIYCHHASLFIPYTVSLFSPEVVLVGVKVRNNMISKSVVVRSFDTVFQNYLPCSIIDGALDIPLKSTPIIEALSLNSWTKLKGKLRGTQKEYPLNMFYRIDSEEPVVLTFSSLNGETPYTMSEHLFSTMKDGDTVDITINIQELQ